MKKSLVVILLLCSALLEAQKNEQPVKVALLLPFQTETVQRDKNIDRFLDFYTGALLAVYEEQRHKPVEVYAYDVGKSASHQLQAVLARQELISMDMIIGPVYAAQVSRMSDWALQYGVRTILPFSSDVPRLKENPYVLQFNPSVEIEGAATAQYLLRQEEPVRCIFVEEDEKHIPESVRSLQQAIVAQGIEHAYTTVGQILHDSLSYSLSEEKNNILLMNTERYANVRVVMPQLMRAAQGKRLTLLSRYAWQQEPITLPQIFSTIFRKEVDVDSIPYGTEYRRFVAKERETGQPCYDLLGYDLMRYALRTIRGIKQATTFDEIDDIICRTFKGVQSDISFVRVGDGGYQNNNIHVVQY
ncbi:MAG: hypothetical protein MJZ64_03135 [Paludibacteraceae bacterium]|nr:hypothetical protein [Paludibacteraceae bacterium]